MKPPRVLMFGWEWPPFNSGGLGVACFGLTEALARRGARLLFVLPKRIRVAAHFLQLLFYDGDHYGDRSSPRVVYGRTPPLRSGEYKSLAAAQHLTAIQELINVHQFDIIHAHDWMSFPPALAAKHLTGKPLVVHIHSTEFDRTGGHRINEQVYEIERQGMLSADMVVAVSQFTKHKLMAHYGIPGEKIAVVHNGITPHHYQKLDLSDLRHLKQGHRLVLFVGRLTLQKGPDYFVRVARKIMEFQPRVRFIIAGSGDMERRIINDAAYAGLGDKIFFAGFLRDGDLQKVYQLADVYVMPSVSEPFGITALEALASGTPAVLSKQSGVVELVQHALKVDFWDIDEMANKILAVLRYTALRKTLVEHGRREIQHCTWDQAAEKCHRLYQQLL